MYGGPSHVDTFDYKPKLYGLDGKTIQVKTFGRGGHKTSGRVVGPKWKFKQYGKSGKWISDLFPNLGTCVDDIAFIHSMYAESPIHGSAMLMMNSGRILSGHPALGSVRFQEHHRRPLALVVELLLDEGREIDEIGAQGLTHGFRCPGDGDLSGG